MQTVPLRPIRAGNDREIKASLYGKMTSVLFFSSLFLFLFCLDVTDVIGALRADTVHHFSFVSLLHLQFSKKKRIFHNEIDYRQKRALSNVWLRYCHQENFLISKIVLSPWGHTQTVQRRNILHRPLSSVINRSYWVSLKSLFRLHVKRTPPPSCFQLKDRIT